MESAVSSAARLEIRIFGREIILWKIFYGVGLEVVMIAFFINIDSIYYVV